MKANHRKKALTFGDLIAVVYGFCGKRRAPGIVQLAVNARVLAFRGQQRFVSEVLNRKRGWGDGRMATVKKSEDSRRAACTFTEKRLIAPTWVIACVIVSLLVQR
jgi:hypothetical protein